MDQDDRWLLQKREQDRLWEQQRSQFRIKRLQILGPTLGFIVLVLSVITCTMHRIDVDAEVQRVVAPRKEQQAQYEHAQALRAIEAENAAKIKELAEQTHRLASFVRCTEVSDDQLCRQVFFPELPVVRSEEHERVQMKAKSDALIHKQALADKWMLLCVKEASIMDRECAAFVEDALEGLED